MQQNSIPVPRVELCAGWECTFRPAERWIVTGSGPRLHVDPICDSCYWPLHSSPLVAIHAVRPIAHGPYTADELEPLRARLTQPALF